MTFKLLAFSDLHANHTMLDKLAKQAEEENVDIVVANGDFSPHNSINEPPKGLIGKFKQIGKKVFVLPGNHETEASIKALEEHYDLKELHGNYTIINGIGIFGCGGAEIGPCPTSDTEIFERLKYAFEKVKNCKQKIMITHAHPANSIMEKFSNFVKGSPAVRKAIDEFKPDIALCGHVHEAEGIEEKIGITKVINVARSGKIITL